MSPREDPEVERLLETLTPASAPPGLRERILEGVSGSRGNGKLVTPILRAGFAACALILASVTITDTLSERSWNARLRVIRGYPGGLAAAAPPPPADDGLIDPLAERIWTERMSFLAASRTSRRTLAFNRALRTLKEEGFGN